MHAEDYHDWIRQQGAVSGDNVEILGGYMSCTPIHSHNSIPQSRLLPKIRQPLLDFSYCPTGFLLFEPHSFIRLLFHSLALPVVHSLHHDGFDNTAIPDTPVDSLVQSLTCSFIHMLTHSLAIQTHLLYPLPSLSSPSLSSFELVALGWD